MAPQQQSRRGGPLRPGHGVGQTAQPARHPFARLLVEDLLDHLHHAVHLRAAADQHHAGADLFLQSHFLQIAIDQLGDLRGARLEDVGQLVLGEDLRRAAAHGGHFDRIVFRHQRAERAAVALLDPLRVLHRRAQHHADVAGEVSGADRQHVRVHDVAFEKDGVIGRAAAEVHQQHAHLPLVLRQHRLGRGELLEHQLLHGDARLVHGGQHVLVVGARAGDDVHVGLQPLGGHAERIVDAVLPIDHELPGDDVQQLELGRDVDRLGGLDDPVDVLAGDLLVLAHHRDHAARVDRADVIAGDADVHRLDLQPGHHLGLVHRFLHRVDGLVEVDDVAAPRPFHRRRPLADDLDLVAIVHLAH